MSCSVSQVVYDALWDLYNSTNGVYWTWSTDLPNSTIWTFPSNLSTPCTDDWQGLACGHESANICFVEKIVLTSYGLSGYLPSSLGNISSLKRLELAENLIIGTIPFQLGDLISLEYLFLYSNRLNGTIPCELGNLESLLELALYLNGLSGTIPCQLGNLQLIQQLIFYSNELTGTIPSELGGLESLEYLYLYLNRLNGTIPSELGNLTLLQRLDLHSNSLSGTVPCELGDLSSLVQLVLFSNSLSGTIPCELGKLQSMQELTAYLNRLTGSIPSELGNARSLHQLYLNSNSLCGTIPSELGTLQSLLYLELFQNSLTGTIPCELGNIKDLQHLILYSNNLHGSIPCELGMLESLRQLLLHFNSISGPIPCQLGNLGTIRQLIFNSNRLTGTIPCELGNLTTLRYLELYINSLSGSIPSELGNLRLLNSLVLYTNSLIGTIPEELGNLDSAVYLLLFSNRLTGPIPISLQNLRLLDVMLLDSNMLTGELDGDVFGGMSQLETLGLAGNEFSGSLPEELTKPKRLLAVFLNDNLFTGLFSLDLSHCYLLENFDISNNFFSGDIAGVASLPNVLQVSAARNMFTGSIPEASFGLLLESLDFSGNYLFGSIGHQFSNCSQLKNIALGDNLIAGTIPGYLFNLQSLVSMNLSDNELSGGFSGVAAIRGTLQSLDVSSNHLSGALPSLLLGSTSLQDVLLFDNCFSGSLPETLCSSTALEYLVLNQLSSNCGTGFSRTLRRIFRGEVTDRLMSGSIPDCLWGLSSLKLLQLSGNGLRGSITAELKNSNSSLRSLLLFGNQMTGSIPNWIQTSTVLQQVDLSQNRLSGTLSRSLQISSTASLYSVSVNRLSGGFPDAMLSTSSNLSLDALNGNQFSCSSSGDLAGWGSVLTEENLPLSDPDHDTYICGSSLFDDYLLFAAVLLIVFTIAVLFSSLKEVFSLKASNVELEVVDSHGTVGQGMSVVTESETRKTWWLLGLFSVILLVLYVSFHQSLIQFSTHSKQYMWMTTAAFLRGWAPVFIILLVVGVGEILVVVNYGISSPFGVPGATSERKNLLSRTQYIRNVVIYASVHVLNIVAVVATNSAYVYSIVQGLPRSQLLVVQFFLGCFKLAWNGTVIPFLLGSIEGDPTAHRIFMSLFAFIGGPFISTFFSASNCFLYTLIPQAPLMSTIDAPHYSCFSTCGAFCPGQSCVFACPSVCEFELTAITTTSTPAWIYSYQCSSTLLINYVPVMIASMAISVFLLPCILIAQFGPSDQCGTAFWNRITPRSLMPRDMFDVVKLGRFIRVKVLVNMATMLTFGFASPMLGVLIMFDTMLWCRISQLLVLRHIEYVNTLTQESFSSVAESRNQESFANLSRLSNEMFKESAPSLSDILMVLSFVGVFWSLFVFDMIGDLYGNLTGGLTMLEPLLFGTVIWLVAKQYLLMSRSVTPIDRTVTSPGLELSDDQYVKSPAHQQDVLT